MTSKRKGERERKQTYRYPETQKVRLMK